MFGLSEIYSLPCLQDYEFIAEVNGNKMADHIKRVSCAKLSIIKTANTLWKIPKINPLQGDNVTPTSFYLAEWILICFLSSPDWWFHNAAAKVSSNQQLCCFLFWMDSFLKALHRRRVREKWGEQNPVLWCRTQNKIRQEHMGCWYPIAVPGVCLQNITYIHTFQGICTDVRIYEYAHAFKCDWT